jgi:hypothetical protein
MILTATEVPRFHFHALFCHTHKHKPHTTTTLDIAKAIRKLRSNLCVNHFQGLDFTYKDNTTQNALIRSMRWRVTIHYHVTI